MAEPQQCIRCHAPMVRGFVLDHGYLAFYVPRWHEGPPKRGLLGGIKGTQGGGTAVGAYRCAACGYLEFYADDSFDG